jgi:uncharacterized membrane protein
VCVAGHISAKYRDNQSASGKSADMGSFSSAKTLGGLGAILTLLLFVPFFVGAVLVIIGWIFILIAVKKISDAVQDASIFNNALIAAVLAIIGVVIFAAVIASTVLGFIGFGSLSASGSTTPPPGMFALIAKILAGLAVAWIVGVVGSYFLWKSFRTLGDKSSVKLFRTAGLVFFIGSILTIIVVGFLVVLVAQILFIVAFFSLPENPPQTMAPPQPRVIGPAQSPPPAPTPGA